MKTILGNNRFSSVLSLGYLRDEFGQRLGFGFTFRYLYCKGIRSQVRKVAENTVVSRDLR